MNLQKYDLVLMDIVMPNLDGTPRGAASPLGAPADPSLSLARSLAGVSATSLIRQFDPMTPIISMTSNSGPNEIMTYFSHGPSIFPSPSLLSRS
jgi:osomolarity two-component system, response regulator SKN7